MLCNTHRNKHTGKWTTNTKWYRNTWFGCVIVCVCVFFVGVRIVQQFQLRCYRKRQQRSSTGSQLLEKRSSRAYCGLFFRYRLFHSWLRTTVGTTPPLFPFGFAYVVYKLRFGFLYKVMTPTLLQFYLTEGLLFFFLENWIVSNKTQEKTVYEGGLKDLIVVR